MKNIIITLFACFIALSINAQENGKMEMHVSLPSSMFKGERNATLSLEIMTEKGDIRLVRCNSLAMQTVCSQVMPA